MVAATGMKQDTLPSSLDRKSRRLLLYARISTLAILEYYNADGLSYQDIKDALGLPDGSLGPNLIWLKENHYVRSAEEKVDRAIAVYYITEEGKQAYATLSSWLNDLLNLQDKKEKNMG